jgi:hypothetical protein
VNCRYCNALIASWWETVLHPACRYRTQLDLYASVFHPQRHLPGWDLDADDQIVWSRSRRNAVPDKTCTLRSAP